jgi:hypothetical protein
MGDYHTSTTCTRPKIKTDNNSILIFDDLDRQCTQFFMTKKQVLQYYQEIYSFLSVMDSNKYCYFSNSIVIKQLIYYKLLMEGLQLLAEGYSYLAHTCMILLFSNKSIKIHFLFSQFKSAITLMFSRFEEIWINHGKYSHFQNYPALAPPHIAISLSPNDENSNNNSHQEGNGAVGTASGAGTGTSTSTYYQSLMKNTSRFPLGNSYQVDFIITLEMKKMNADLKQRLKDYQITVQSEYIHSDIDQGNNNNNKRFSTFNNATVAANNNRRRSRNTTNDNGSTFKVSSNQNLYSEILAQVPTLSEEDREDFLSTSFGNAFGNSSVVYSFDL